MCVIRRHLLACEDIAGGSDMSAGGTFFREIQRPFRWVTDVRWRNHYFVHKKEAFPCVRPWTQLSASPRTILFRWNLFVDHVEDEGEAEEGNDPEPMNPQQRMPTLRGVRALTGRLRGEADVAGK